MKKFVLALVCLSLLGCGAANQAGGDAKAAGSGQATAVTAGGETILIPKILPGCPAPRRADDGSYELFFTATDISEANKKYSATAYVTENYLASQEVYIRNSANAYTEAHVTKTEKGMIVSGFIRLTPSAAQFIDHVCSLDFIEVYPQDVNGTMRLSGLIQLRSTSFILVI